MSETLLERERGAPADLRRGEGRAAGHGDGLRALRRRDATPGATWWCAASYLGVLPARLMAPHRPRAVIGHDACIGKDGAGIQGLFYLEALGIPAAALDGKTAELGNGVDCYEEGVISRVNILAEQCGVHPGMTVKEAAARLRDLDPTDTAVGTKIRRHVVETAPSGRKVVITDSIIFATPEDRDRNVLVTAGHTGRSGAAFLLEFRPWGFICSDGGGAEERLRDRRPRDARGARPRRAPASTARPPPMGDAFSGYYDGVICACNAPARRRGVAVGMSAKEAAHLLLGDG